MKLLNLTRKQKCYVSNLSKSISLSVTLSLLSLNTVYSQVTIGSSNSPDNDALLDLKEGITGTSTKGLLLPRVFLKGLDLPDPLTNHKKGMFVYNRTVDTSKSLTESVYFNDGYKWNNVLSINTEANEYTLTSAITLSDYTGVKISQNVNEDHSTYTAGMTISNLWYPIFETSINISSPLNQLLIEAQLPVQTSQLSGSLSSLSFAVGLFINDKLVAVRLDMVSLSNQYPFFQKQILLSAEDLPIGVNTLKLCFIKRKLDVNNASDPNSAKDIYIGMSFSKASSFTNNFMLRPTMNYSLFESEAI